MTDQPHLVPHSPATIAGDVISAGAILGTIFGYLPYVAAFAGLVWYVIQIWESRTVQLWWRNHQIMLRARRIGRLIAKEKAIQARLKTLEDE